MSVNTFENLRPAAAPAAISPAGRSAADLTGWQRFVRALPLGLALSMVAGVWVGGAVWSFEEQTRLADRLLFAVPWLLPLVLDGLAVSLAGVAYAAALDGRAAVHARAMTALAVIASATSNAAAAASRPEGAGHPDQLAVIVAAGVPVAANLAFEVLLGELRRQVHRRRGLPAPVAIPSPRALRLLLAPLGAFREWRALVLDLTAPGPSVAELAVVELRRRVAGLEADEVRLRDDLLEAHRATLAAEALVPPAAPEPRSPVAGQTGQPGPEGQADGASAGKPARRAPASRSASRSAGRSSTAVTVARLRRQHPGWTVGQIAERAGCTERTARRHLNAPATAAQPAGLTGSVGPQSAQSVQSVQSAQEDTAKEGTGDVAA